MAANTIKAIYVQTAKPAAEFAADTTTVWVKNLLLIEEDTLKMKMGDGVNTYGDLKYANLSTEEVKQLKELYKELDTNINGLTEEEVMTINKVIIKHIDDIEHKKLTGISNMNILDFAKYLSEKNMPVWIRHVVVPQITFNEKYLKELGEFLSTLKNIKALDILPYHNMAIPKYENLRMDYPLKDIPPLTKEEAIKARDIILNSMKRHRR